MKFINWFWAKKNNDQAGSSHETKVEQATIVVLKKYDKTFRDLAKYDRERDLSSAVSK